MASDLIETAKLHGEVLKLHIELEITKKKLQMAVIKMNDVNSILGQMTYGSGVYSEAIRTAFNHIASYLSDNYDLQNEYLDKKREERDGQV